MRKLNFMFMVFMASIMQSLTIPFHSSKLVLQAVSPSASSLAVVAVIVAATAAVVVVAVAVVVVVERGGGGQNKENKLQGLSFYSINNKVWCNKQKV